MKPLFIYSLFLSFAFCFSGCEQASIQEQALAFKSNVVVNSLFSPDTPWEVTLHTTKNILASDREETIQNAEVTILDLDTDEEIQLAYISPGYYLNENVFPVEGHHYQVIVKAEDYEYISAEGQVPQKIKDTSHEITKTKDEENGIVSFNIKLTLEDDPSQDNYVGWEAFLLTSNTTLTEGPRQLPIESEDSSIASDNKYYTKNDTLIDITISAESVEFKDDVPAYIQIKAYSVSEDYYKFFQSQNFSDINSSISQAPPIHTNINGGLGIFGGFVEKQIQIEVR